MAVFRAEMLRAIRLSRSYWVEYVSDFLLYALGFLLLILLPYI